MSASPTCSFRMQQIDNRTTTGGLVKGEYSDSAWILGGQYSMGF